MDFLAVSEGKNHSAVTRSDVIAVEMIPIPECRSWHGREVLGSLRHSESPSKVIPQPQSHPSKAHMFFSRFLG